MIGSKTSQGSSMQNTITTCIGAFLLLLLGLVCMGGQETCAQDATVSCVDRLVQLRAQKVETRQTQASADLERMNIRLGAWHCIGPFKDGLFESLMLAFETSYPPEKAALAAENGDRDFLSAEYQVDQLPGMLEDETLRRWTQHDEWTDGYRHLLPRGPAPSRSEIVYMTRTITVDEDAELEMKLFAEDYVRVWLNGEQIGEAHRRFGPNRFPSEVATFLQLKKGENRLLVKIGSLHSAHGFAFSLPAIHPNHHLSPGAWDESIRLDGPTAKNGDFSPLNRPYMSATSASSGSSYAAPTEQEERLAAIARCFDLEISEAAGIVDESKNADVQELAHIALECEDALKQLDRYRASLQMIPMHDPPKSAMDEMLKESARASEQGAKYDRLRTELGREIDLAMEAFDHAKPGAVGQVIASAGRVARQWHALMAELPPIAFIQRPRYSINAIAPYDIKGTTPASICVLDPSVPDAPARTIFHDPDMAIYDMNLSWDAKTIFFSAHKGKHGNWQLYKINVDGTGLTQLTNDPGSSFISPCELPDGRIVYVSTQANTWVQCQGRKAGLLYVCEADGSSPRKVSANIDSDHSPQVMDDGRILFTRWDYGIEKNVFARHALWTMNPDGTDFRLFFGNTIEDPAGFWKARQISGRPEVVCVFGPHHNNQAGMVGVVWNRLGREAPRGEGFRFITDEIPCYCDNNVSHGFQDPFPLSERLFLCSYGGDGQGRNRLYLLDDLGNRACLYEAEDGLSCFYPIPVTPRKKPPTLADRSLNPMWTYRDPVEMNQETPDDLWGTLNVRNVYQGLEGYVEPGEAKSIQIVEQVQKSRCMAGGEAWGHTPIIGRGTVHVRRVIGTVPIESDGSANFQVPALRSISLNVLDAEGRTIMRMGSDMHVMPGENRSCIGCHEDRHRQVAPGDAMGLSLATRKPPMRPVPGDWNTNGLLDYQKVVQPVWDRYCVECHGGATPDGGLSLVGDRTRFFCVSYDNLIDRALADHTNVFALDHDDTVPKTVGAVVSPILKYIESAEHSGHEIPREDRYRIYAWIDANVPYYSTYTYTKVRGIGARDSWETAKGTNDTGWMIGHVADVFSRRCMECHERTVHNQALYGSASFTVSSKHWTTRSLTSHGAPGRYPMSLKYGPEFRLNLTNPEHSLMLAAPLGKVAGGLGYCKQADGTPVFAGKDDPDYQRMLTAIQMGKHRLYAEPRVDMPTEHVEALAPSLWPLEELNEKLFIPSGLSEGLEALPAVPEYWKSVLKGAKASSPDGHPLQGEPPRVSVEAAIDGRQETYWDDIDNQAVYRYRVDLAKKETVCGLSIVGWQHHDFAPRDFTILCDGLEIGHATHVKYQDNELIIAMPETPCSRVELKITGSYGGSPAMRELNLFSGKR